MIMSPTQLLAQCADQPRSVTLDKQNIAPLKSYLCSAGSGSDAAQFRVEYYHLTDVAVSLLLTNGSSTKLRKTLGGAKLMENEVSRTYASLLSKVGVARELPKDNGLFSTSFSLSPTDDGTATDSQLFHDNTPFNETSDTLSQRKLRTLVGLADPSGDDYPAITEMTALKKRTIPPNLNYFYSFEGADTDCEKLDFTCKKFGSDNVRFSTWRYMTADDAKNYAASVLAYNNLLLQVRKNKKDAKEDFIRPEEWEGGYYDLVSYLSNGQWPKDFLLMIGNYVVEDSCGTAGPGELPKLTGWSFRTIPRDVRIDAVLIENLSKQPLAIGGLFGGTDSNAALRVVDPAFADPAGPVALEGTSGTIPPGQSAIVLTRILFLVPDFIVSDFRKYRESMDAIHETFGSDGFTGNVAAYQAPDVKAYAYGPTMRVSGALVNSMHVDFTAHPTANFIRLTYGAEAGSCPYLLSWDDGDHEWINHGKILHRGQGKAKSYTEISSLPGLRTHFRIEEREPELAHLKPPKLVVAFSDGSTRTLQPTDPANDVANITLRWGERADFTFATEGMNPSDVVESRLEVTGYYERYSDPLADREPETISTPVPVRINYDVPDAELSKRAPASRRMSGMQPRQ
jgi:hypothetical protein